MPSHANSWLYSAMGWQTIIEYSLRPCKYSFDTHGHVQLQLTWLFAISLLGKKSKRLAMIISDFGVIIGI